MRDEDPSLVHNHLFLILHLHDSATEFFQVSADVIEVDEITLLD